MSPEQEAGAEWVVRVELEARPARAERAALDLGDDGRPAADLRLADDAAAELAADDAQVAKLLAAREPAAVEEREPRRRAAAARRAVDLAVGEDGDIALRVAAPSSCQKMTP